MDPQYSTLSFDISRLVTQRYSTSFSLGITCFDPQIRGPIYSLYGFVRFADEIVDSFHEYDKAKLLDDFERDFYKAKAEGISLNPILNSFQQTVKRYNIDDDLIQAFISSMRSDLLRSSYSEKEIKDYIYGSADVVGLMCLKIFVDGNQSEYDRLKPYAMRLGSAFQKINFLRDIGHDIQELHRIYFPVLRIQPLNESTKKEILEEIEEDYKVAMQGIRQLPKCAYAGVYTAYLYYYTLTRKIEKTPANILLTKRVRVSDYEKIWLFVKAFVSTKFN